jgi:hypothetical protein
MKDRELTGVRGLLDLTVKASHVAFLSRSMHLTLQYPLVEGQMAVLERLAAIVAERASDVHRHLEAALNDRDPGDPV